MCKIHVVLKERRSAKLDNEACDIGGKLGSIGTTDICRQAGMPEKVGEVENNLSNGLLVEVAVVEDIGAQDPETRHFPD